MAFDFPPSPVEGSTFTPPGGPQYVWNAPTWKVNTAAPPATPGDFVLKSGDVMTGPLQMAYPHPAILLSKTASDQNAHLYGALNGVPRWIVIPGDANAEGGGNTGSHFAIFRCNDAGVPVGAPLTLDRTNGVATFSAIPQLPAADPTTANQATRQAYVERRASEWAYAAAADRVAKTGDTMSGALRATGFYASGSIFQSDGADAILAGSGGNVFLRPHGAASGTGQAYVAPDGHFVSSNHIQAVGIVYSSSTFQSTSANAVIAGSGGHIYFRPHGNANAAYETIVQNDGTLSVAGLASASTFAPKAWVFGGFHCKNGASGDLGPNRFNLIWAGGVMGLFVDDTGLGQILTSSDYRIKKDVEDLPSMWETAKKYRPVKYTHQEWWPVPMEDEDGAVTKEVTAPLVEADDIERWGFIAHELQEASIASAATGEKDQVNTLQSPNPWTMLAVVVKTLQEAMQRIEALEAAAKE